MRFLADYYRYLCDDMEPEQRKPLGLKWLYRMIEVLAKKADKGVVSAVKSLMNLYIHDRPYDMTEKEGRDAAVMWHERLIEILRAKAELRKKVDKIDSTAIEDPEGLWSTMIEEMGAGIC